MKRAYRGIYPINRMRAKRAAVFARGRCARHRQQETNIPPGPVPAPPIRPQGYDPELLYVECGRCGSPVVWDDGRATKLLAHAGIDPIELDATCVLVTDACPACGASEEYGVRIFRVTERSSFPLPPSHGNA